MEDKNKIKTKTFAKFLILSCLFCVGRAVLAKESTYTVYTSKVSVQEVEEIDQVKPLSLKEAIKQACEEYKLGAQCIKDVSGIAMVESRMDVNVKDGDVVNGDARAVGAFQLHYRLHKISYEDAKDPLKSAEWTVNHLIENGYTSGYRKWAIGSHNSRTPSINARYSNMVLLAESK